MTIDAHRHLLEHLATCKGKFMLSMYRHVMYDDFANQHGWQRVDSNLPNNSAGGSEKRRMTECIWMNFPPVHS